MSDTRTMTGMDLFLLVAFTVQVSCNRAHRLLRQPLLACNREEKSRAELNVGKYCPSKCTDLLAFVLIIPYKPTLRCEEMRVKHFRPENKSQIWT